MFGLFKKKQAHAFQDAHRNAIAHAASLLQLQLATCKSLPGYSRLIRTDFARGYIYGFFDGAIQASEIPDVSDSDLVLLNMIGHGIIFGGDSALESYVAESVQRQGADGFDAGQSCGGTEFFDFAQGKVRQANTLEHYLHKASQ